MAADGDVTHTSVASYVNDLCDEKSGPVSLGNELKTFDVAAEDKEVFHSSPSPKTIDRGV